MKLKVLNEENIAVSPTIEDDTIISNKKKQDKLKKRLKPILDAGKDLVKKTTKNAKMIDDGYGIVGMESAEDLNESLNEAMPGDENYFEIKDNDVYYKGHKFKLLKTNSKDQYFLIDPINFTLIDWGADPIEVAVADGYPQKACDEYLARLHEDFEIYDKDLTKNAAWNTGRLNMRAGIKDEPKDKIEDEKGSDGYWDLAWVIADELDDATRENPKGAEAGEIIYNLLKYKYNKDLKRLVNDQNFNESLIEDLEIDNQNSGISSWINNLIKDEWEAVDGYKMTLMQLENLENKDSYENIMNNLNDILEEEMVHIGQLQAVLKDVEPAADFIDTGKVEAEEETDKEKLELR